jgi:hypothetical protein
MFGPQEAPLDLEEPDEDDEADTAAAFLCYVPEFLFEKRDAWRNLDYEARNAISGSLVSGGGMLGLL